MFIWGAMLIGIMPYIYKTPVEVLVENIGKIV
ncbi:hypothetical protein SAMN00017477_1953 [Peptoniphilus asaccharolyticus DSM 20463]|uniref:Uncharacterized protein n=1 Tax=Peptoniphilus asaccharolyticus DSM 20463 TaxID=573058 RepID=A0A1W1VHI1_PEPAS|nr:hypothetical protein SAMN00017477_1953 [Peptoniphilus asaccharolyticus DSM 20463]